MRIAFPVNEKSEEYTQIAISPVFGRTRYFLIIDEEGRKPNFVDNLGLNMSNAAGMHAAITLINNSCDVVVVKNIGPKAKMVLEEAGIKIINAGSKINRVGDYFK